MALQDLRTSFLANRVAQQLARRGFFSEKSAGALGEAVRGVFLEELARERAIDEEARRLLDGMRAQIAAQGADTNELYRKIRRKLAEQRGIVL